MIFKSTSDQKNHPFKYLSSLPLSMLSLGEVAKVYSYYLSVDDKNGAEISLRELEDREQYTQNLSDEYESLLLEHDELRDICEDLEGEVAHKTDGSVDV